MRDVAPSLGAAPLTEAYDRLRPRPALTWRGPAALLRLERRLLGEEARRYREARELAEAGVLVLADTGFLGPLTYTRALVARGAAPHRLLARLVDDARELAEQGRWGLPDAFVYLVTPSAERHRRAARDPLGHPPSLQPRHQAAGAAEARFYRATVAPAFGARFRFVSGDGAPSRVAARVRRAVAALRDRRIARRPVAPILTALGEETVP